MEDLQNQIVKELIGMIEGSWNLSISSPTEKRKAYFAQQRGRSEA